jgi:hypothetical protein
LGGTAFAWVTPFLECPYYTIIDIHHNEIVGAEVKRFLVGIWKYAELEGVRGVYRVQFEVAETMEMEQVFVGLRFKFY